MGGLPKAGRACAGALGGAVLLLAAVVVAVLQPGCDGGGGPSPVVVDVTGLRCPEHAFVNWEGACECNDGYVQSQTELECLPEGAAGQGGSSGSSVPAGAGGSGGGSAKPLPPGCTPECDGRDCGDDGCGGVCGTCDAVTAAGEQAFCYVGRCVLPGAPLCKPYEVVDFNECFFGCVFADTDCWDACQTKLDAKSGCSEAYSELASCAGESGCPVWLTPCLQEECADELRLVRGDDPNATIPNLCGYASACEETDLCPMAGGSVVVETEYGSYCSAPCMKSTDCISNDTDVQCVAVKMDDFIVGYCLRPLTYYSYSVTR